MIKPARDRRGAECGCGKLPVLFLQLSISSRDRKVAVMACVWWIVASGKGYEIQITEPKNISAQVKVNSNCCHYLELGIIKKGE